jgi:hypothetical protein
MQTASIYNIYGHGDHLLGQSLYEIESHKVDLFDEDLEDDDVELYQSLDIGD